MKKFYLAALLVLLPSLGIYAQESEETDNMVIEMQDGSKMTIAIDKVKEILFQKGNISVPGNDLLSLPEKLAQITSQIELLNARNAALEALVASMNAKLTTLETITNALSDADYITNITTNAEGDYVISFSKHGSIVIHNGKDGQDAPIMMRVTSIDYMNGYITIELYSGQVVKVPLIP